MADVVVHAPAKLNLFLEALSKRADGYHEIETLMVPIDIFDTLYFREDPSGQVALVCRKASGVWGPGGAQLGELPEGAENLVLRAVELLRSRAELKRGASLRLVKRIPTAAGLGGGSSDAAAALIAANRGWRLGWSRVELASLAAELGSDVPFFVVGGAAICRGRGEQVEPLSGLGTLHFVVVRPPVGMSTADVYRHCRIDSSPRSMQPLCESLVRGDLERLGGAMFNRLQPAAELLSPWIGRVAAALAAEDIPGHQMSGSGSCYFGLCRHALHARRIANRLRAKRIGMAFAVRVSR